MKTISFPLVVIIRIEPKNPLASELLESALEASSESSHFIHWNLPLDSTVFYGSTSCYALKEWFKQEKGTLLAMGNQGIDHNCSYRKNIDQDMHTEEEWESILSGYMPLYADFNRKSIIKCYKNKELPVYSAGYETINGLHVLIKTWGKTPGIMPLITFSPRDFKSGSLLKRIRKNKNRPLAVRMDLQELIDVEYLASCLAFLAKNRRRINTAQPMDNAFFLPMNESSLAGEKRGQLHCPQLSCHLLQNSPVTTHFLEFDMPGFSSLSSGRNKIFFTEGRLSRLANNRSTTTGPAVRSSFLFRSPGDLKTRRLPLKTISASSISEDTFWGLREFLSFQNKEERGTVIADCLTDEGSGYFLINLDVKYPDWTPLKALVSPAPFELPLFFLRKTDSIQVGITYPDKEVSTRVLTPVQRQGVLCGQKMEITFDDLEIVLFFANRDTIQSIPFCFEEEKKGFRFYLSPLGCYQETPAHFWKNKHFQTSFFLYLKSSSEEIIPPLPSALIQEAYLPVPQTNSPLK